MKKKKRGRPKYSSYSCEELLLELIVRVSQKEYERFPKEIRDEVLRRTAG